MDSTHQTEWKPTSTLTEDEAYDQLVAQLESGSIDPHEAIDELNRLLNVGAVGAYKVVPHAELRVSHLY